MLSYSPRTFASVLLYSNHEGEQILWYERLKYQFQTVRVAPFNESIDYEKVCKTILEDKSRLYDYEGIKSPYEKVRDNFFTCNNPALVFWALNEYAWANMLYEPLKRPGKNHKRPVYLIGLRGAIWNKNLIIFEHLLDRISPKSLSESPYGILVSHIQTLEQASDIFNIHGLFEKDIRIFPKFMAALSDRGYEPSPSEAEELCLIYKRLYPRDISTYYYIWIALFAGINFLIYIKSFWAS